MNLEIGLATLESDLLGSIGVLQEVSVWLEFRGLGLWNSHQFTLAWAVSHQSELVVAKINGEVIATMLLQLEDADFWADFPLSEAVFVHKLAVARNFAGHKIAQELLEFAANEAQRLGRKFVRLDCAPRDALIHFYESAKFEKIDQITVNHFTVWRLERRL
jgi:GNAT superfamily N-acetyltransferase